MLHDGLAKGKEKYPLLNLMGEVEWKSGRLPEAIYWWIQGLICQETRQGFGREAGAYLHLSYVADTLGLSTLAEQLRERVDFIRPGKIRLSSDAANSLIGLVRQSETSQIKKALEVLQNRYFAPSLQPETTPQKNSEIADLLRIAQDTSLDDRERAKAIERLAEVGDSTAIGPLMALYARERQELSMIKFFVRDALDAIRSRGR